MVAFYLYLITPPITRVYYGFPAVILIGPQMMTYTGPTSRILQLRLKPLNFMSCALHGRAIVFWIAGGPGMKSCKKIVHDKSP